MPRSTHGDKYTVSVMKTVEDKGEEVFENRKILRLFIFRGKSCLLRADIENYRFSPD